MHCSTSRLLRRAALLTALATVLWAVAAEGDDGSSSSVITDSSSSVVLESSSSVIESSSENVIESSSSSSEKGNNNEDCDFEAFKSALVVTTDPTTCAGGEDGTLTARFAEGSGCSSTLFTLSDGTTQRSAADGTFTGLRAGEYVLVARYSDTANAEVAQTVGSADPIAFAVDAEDLNDDVCTACRSRAKMSVTGGHAPYTYGTVEPNTVCFCPTLKSTNEGGSRDTFSLSPLPFFFGRKMSPTPATCGVTRETCHRTPLSPSISIFFGILTSCVFIKQTDL